MAMIGWQSKHFIIKNVTILGHHLLFYSIILGSCTQLLQTSADNGSLSLVLFWGTFKKMGNLIVYGNVYHTHYIQCICLVRSTCIQVHKEYPLADELPTTTHDNDNETLAENGGKDKNFISCDFPASASSPVFKKCFDIDILCDVDSSNVDNDKKGKLDGNGEKDKYFTAEIGREHVSLVRTAVSCAHWQHI